MQVISVDGLSAVCRGRYEQANVSLALIDDVAPGDHVLVYLGSAVRSLDADEAGKIADALDAIARAARGESFEHLLDDLIDREPELPAHLRNDADKQKVVV